MPCTPHIRPKGVAIAVEQTTGRQSLNIHGAINLETGHTQMLEVAKVNAKSLIALLKAVEAAHPHKRRIHVHLDNASYHHAKRVREWLKRQERKCILHFHPALLSSSRSDRAMLGPHASYTTHNRDYKTFEQFRAAILTFLNQTIPKKWEHFRDRINDNFRVISPANFRIVA